MKETKRKDFANGTVYALATDDGYPVEVTDTFLPFYTKDAIGRKQNKLVDGDMGDRTERWMIGVSCMSGCPVRCKFCATGQLRRWRCLTAQEIVDQVEFIVARNPGFDPRDAKEFKINYTRMGEPFLNIQNVRAAICAIDALYPNAHHYLSTIGVAGSDFGWIKDNVTLQVSLHSLDEEKRNWLIPYRRKIPLADLGQIRTESRLKTTLNLTLVDDTDWDADKLAELFDKDKFFVKISPINENCISNKNQLGKGVVEGVNLK
jgi:23S rRNA (adenine2503-C2)-methyltransferase